jgi:hypothetical protein
MREIDIGDFFLLILNIILDASQKDLYSRVCEPATLPYPVTVFYFTNIAFLR